MKQVHNASTGAIEVRDLTDEELEQHAADRQEIDRLNAETAAREAARQSAIDKLAALGRTVAELQALIP